MKTLPICLMLVLSLVTTFPTQADAPRGRLLFLGIAYDEAPPKGQSADHYNYAPDNFTTLFNSQSSELFSEIKTDTLKGNAATRPAVANKLRVLQRVAKADDLVFIYWGTHGGTDKRGWAANLPGDGQVLGTEIKAELAKLPCPALVAISTCGSGGFVRTNPQQVDLPKNVAAICACRRKQTTNNELDVSLLEALAGFGDQNGDGQVTIGEALHYVPIRYGKLMRDSETPDLQPVLGHAENFAIDRPLSKVGDSHVGVVYDNVWYGATILERLQNRVKVRYLGFDSKNPNGGFAFADEIVKLERVDLPGGFPPVEVEWDGQWYAATILARVERGFKIHYVGYPDTDDEVVPPKRIRFPFVGGQESLSGPRKRQN